MRFFRWIEHLLVSIIQLFQKIKNIIVDHVNLFLDTPQLLSEKLVFFLVI
jgi:hypothetical protein